MSQDRQTRTRSGGYRPPRDKSGLSALTEGFLIAWEAMRANLLRSVLTVMGVAVGVSVVVAFGALMTGLRSSVMDAFEAAGPDNFVVTRFDFTAITIDNDGQRPAARCPQRLAQARRLRIVVKRRTAVQFDGEPEHLSPSIIDVEHHGAARMLLPSDEDAWS